MSLRQKYGVWLLLIVVAALILPRLSIDYGRSGDARDNAYEARQLVEHGFAQGLPLMHRWPPGVPLFTYVLTAIVPWGNHLATNAVAMISYLVAVFLFYEIVRGSENARLSTILFALSPMVLKSASETMDFEFGLALVLAFYLALRREKDVWAGVFLGLCIGTRITTIFFLVPTGATVLFARGSTDWQFRLRRLALIVSIAGVVASSLYLPYLIYSGMGLRFFVPGKVHQGPLLPKLPVGIYNLLYVLGPLAVVGLVVVFVAERHRIRSILSSDLRSRDAETLFALTTIPLFCAVCCRFTMKREYFLPAVPFIVLLLHRWLSPRGLVIATILIFSFAFVSLELKGGRSGQRHLAAHLVPGILVEDYQMRTEIVELRAGISTLRGLGRAVVLTGMGGELTMGNDLLAPVSSDELAPNLSPTLTQAEYRASATTYRLRDTDVFLVHTLERSDADRLRSLGYRLYMFSEFAPSMAASLGSDPYSLGVEILPILDSNAFYKSSGLRLGG
jgi:hypothetical protein